MSAIPQIDGLTIEDFLKFARTKPEVLKYLPNESQWNHIDKKWLCDILYTLDPQGVQAMVNKAMTDRKQKLEQSQNLIVEMRPEFANALKKSISFSCKLIETIALTLIRIPRQVCLSSEAILKAQKKEV